MGPLSPLSQVKKRKRERFYSQRALNTCDLMSPQMHGVVGRADVTVPILWMKDGGLRGQRLDLVWVECTSG